MLGRNRRAPRKTTAELRNEAASHGTIRAQNQAGQREFVKSSTLPAKMDSAARAALQKAGVRFGRPVSGDPLFVTVQLPAGWKKAAALDSDFMWTDLLDGKGTLRARIFYKAAAYDRRAELYIV